MIARIFNQKYRLLVLSTFSLLGILIYSNTFYSSFHFDDVPSIVNNPAIKNICNLQAIWNCSPTRFITYLSIAFNYHLSQLDVFSYHLFNLTVHVSSAILVWLLMLLTFSTPAMNGKKITKQVKPISFFAGLIFLTHPIQTQGVTYIIQRTTSLATLFYLACLVLYVKSRLLLEQGESPIARRLFYSSSLVTAFMAIFTKEMALTIPLMILLYECCFLKTKENFHWKYILPFFAIIFVIPLTILLNKSIYFLSTRKILNDVFHISSWNYFLSQLRGIVTYLRLLFIPINQNLEYDYPIAKSLLELPVLASLIFLVSIIITAIRIFSKYRLLSFSIFWFFLTLLPYLGIIPTKDIILEHRLYLPMVGFSFFMVCLIYYFFENKPLKLMVIVLLVITSGLAVFTYRRNFIWKDEFTLWNDVVYKTPKKARPYNNRGLAYYVKGNLKQAFSDFTKAIAIDPNYTDAYYNRGLAYDKQGNLSVAISDYNKAIEINSNDADIYNNRGLVYKKQGNLPVAISDFTKAIEIDPNDVKPYGNRAVTYFILKEYDNAWADVHKAENLGFSFTYNNLFISRLKQASGRDK